MKTLLLNPYTGKPRHPSDIASDPAGILIVEPGAPMMAAPKTPAERKAAERHVRPRFANANGWLEAARAWEVCASIHETFAKTKDVLYTTRHSDFVRRADDSRKRAQSDDGTLLRAADMLTAYAELIRRDGATRVEEHHYLPDVEFIAAGLRERAVRVA